MLLLAAIFSFRSDDGKRTKFIETSYMDSSVKPGDNFYLFANGGWLKKAVIPPSEYRVGAFLDVYTRTRQHLKYILDSVSSMAQTPGSIEQKVGDFYLSGMDTATIERRGIAPLIPYLNKIKALTDVKSVMQFEAEMHRQGFSYIALMMIGPDIKNTSRNIAMMDQTGIGLPDRDYYFRTDAATETIQKAYKDHIKDVLMLTGDDSSSASLKAEAVYELEKKMAESHRTNVQLRDPQTNYHKMAVSDLAKTMPLFAWPSFLERIGAKTDSLNMSHPAYYNRIEALLNSTPISTWQAYYQYHITEDVSPYLSKNFENLNFNFFSLLTGQRQNRPRWERIYLAEDDLLGEALGQLYVKRYFNEAAKVRMMELVGNLQNAFEEHINNLDWMSEVTKQQAKAKLHAFIKKIGFPDKWRDYSKVRINRTTFFENFISCLENNYRYQLNKLNKPVDKTEWLMTPPTINAYYYASFNEIVFPAGMLQFPYFDVDADDAVNYGAIGTTIGHEMTHGFDDKGAQYDKEGNLKNWWEHEDSLKFVAKAKSVIELYNSFTILDTVHINGALTTGENIADMAGVTIAYDAFKMTKQGRDTIRIDGFTPDQRFFISYAQSWRNKQTDELTRLSINTNPHSPRMYRVNAPLENFTPFYEAFHVEPGDKMYLPEDRRIKIW
jgi:putative endopeptidase